MKRTIGILVLCALVLSACGTATTPTEVSEPAGPAIITQLVEVEKEVLVTPTPESVSDNFIVPLGWLLTDEFIGVATAQRLGYYAEAGFPQVTFIAGGGATGLDAIKAINGMAGNVRMGIAPTMYMVLRAYASGLDVVVVTSQLQQDPTAFLGLLDDGKQVKGPCDFKGHVVAQQSDSQWLAAALGEVCPADQGGPLVPGKDFTLIPAGFSPDCLMVDQCDYHVVFAVDQPFIFESEGLQRGTGYDWFLASDYLPFYYALPIITTHQYIKDHPDIVDAFVKASVRGLQYNLDYPTESIEIAANIEGVTREHATWRIPVQNQLVINDDTAAHGIGWTNPEKVQEMIQFLYDHGQIDHVFDANEVIDNSFLPGPQ